MDKNVEKLPLARTAGKATLSERECKQALGERVVAKKQKAAAAHRPIQYEWLSKLSSDKILFSILNGRMRAEV